MRIENRRSHVETVVTKEEWAQMVDQQTSKLFKVIDKDETIIRGKIKIPREIEEFKAIRVERIVPESIISDDDLKIIEQEMEQEVLKSKPIKK